MSLFKRKSVESVELSKNEKCFNDYFAMVSGILSASSLADKPIIPDIFAALLTVLQFDSEFYDFNIDIDRNNIIKGFFKPLLEINETEYKKIAKAIDDKMKYFYQFIRYGELDESCLQFGLKQERKNWPPYRIGVLLCSSLYEKWPIMEKSCFDNAIECIEQFSREIIEINL